MGCPNTAWLLFLLFASGLVALVAFSVYLSKKRLNLAVLGIGVDFLQVLSIFSAFKFEWPPALVSLYNAMSIAAFNLDILAPECRWG